MTWTVIYRAVQRRGGALTHTVPPSLASYVKNVRRSISKTSQLQTESNVPSFTGVWPIMATPFHPDESIDENSFRRSIKFMHDCGADGVTILGVMGESNRMLDSERERLIRVGIEAAGDMVCSVPYSDDLAALL